MMRVEQGLGLSAKMVVAQMVSLAVLTVEAERASRTG